MSWEEVLKAPFSATRLHYPNNGVDEAGARKLFAEHLDPLFRQEQKPGQETRIQIGNPHEWAAKNMGMNGTTFWKWYRKLYPGFRTVGASGDNPQLVAPAKGERIYSGGPPKQKKTGILGRFR